MSHPHVLITGGSSGIGRALARQLAAAGYNLSLVARRPELLAETARELEAQFAGSGQRVVTVPADVSNAAEAAAAVAQAVAAQGVPDLVITSAGIAVPGHFEDLALEVHERTMDVNYFGSLHVVRAVLPAMRARKSGRIVFISSGAGLMGMFGYGAYAPSKFALRGLAEGLRAELRADGVAVSIAYPPDTETPMLVEENKTKPEETKLITSVVKAWSAEAVASCIMRGIRAGKFSITPGATIWGMSHMPGIALPLLHWYADFLAASVRKRKQRSVGAVKPPMPAFER